MTPEICIGIPTLNGPRRLERCLEAIRKHTDLEKFKAQVVVSDDFSYESELAENKKICANFGFDLLLAKARLGVAQQWGCLTRHTEAPFVILMNDDVEVVPDWLDALAFSLKENPWVGMIGLKAYEGVTSAAFTRPPTASYNEAVLERGYKMIASTGFLFGFSRAAYEAVEGFDPHFFAFYEEVDFGLRLLKSGRPSYMLSYPIVLHQGGATTSDKRNIQADKVLLESREKFIVKHGGSIESIRRGLIENSWPTPKQWNTMLKTWID